MKTLKFSINISAPKDKVWDILWNDATYPQWTAVFAVGSRAPSDWKQLSSILFTDGIGNGMYSIIEKKDVNRQMTFKHLGMLKDRVEEPVDDDTKSWSGSLEDYQLTELHEKTALKVTLDSIDEFAAYFEDKFPKALEKIKELSEQS